MKKSDITILVDVDDVLINLGETWIYFLNKKFGLNVDAAEIVSWDISQYFPSLTKDAVLSPLFENELWDTVKPFPDAQFYLERLYNEGFNVYICTANHYKSLSYKIDKAVAPNFPFIPPENYIMTHNKHMISGDIIIDDGLHNLDNSRKLCLLVDTPHNQVPDNELSSNTKRVFNWRQIYQEIENFSKE